MGYDFFRFNTSHVVVYHERSLNQEIVYQSFNTSHVVVYLVKMRFVTIKRNAFQYISCCSLS